MHPGNIRVRALYYLAAFASIGILKLWNESPCERTFLAAAAVLLAGASARKLVSPCGTNACWPTLPSGFAP